MCVRMGCIVIMAELDYDERRSLSLRLYVEKGVLSIFNKHRGLIIVTVIWMLSTF